MVAAPSFRDSVSHYHSRDGVSRDHSWDGVSQSHSRDGVSRSYSRDGVSRSRDGVSRDHSWDGVSQSYSRDGVSRSHSRDGVSRSYSRDGVSQQSHTPDTTQRRWVSRLVGRKHMQTPHALHRSTRRHAQTEPNPRRVAASLPGTYARQWAAKLAADFARRECPSPSGALSTPCSPRCPP